MRSFLATLGAVALLLPGLPAIAGELSPAGFSQARKLYLVKCAKCHELYDPHAYGDAEWQEWMVKMKKKSKLKNDQFELLMNYLSSVRAQPK